ncbi:MAG: PGPGW domain-containing protein [Alphaproteobacteria bacterium]|uniref:PGPGW domain-containing protein n=1 Tax=Candidatus Nitrobium versatile TaxID=2884831 RepID=A0A953JC78_9BACT|nr:PGPGW domain-containing protein [Candidatus Nitrobium versatile]
MSRYFFRKVKRVVIAVAGFSVLAVGLLMIVLPGPAFIVIPIGLGILATEFSWAGTLLEKTKEVIRRKSAKWRGNKEAP